MVPSKSYLIPVEEGDLESLVDRCLDRAFKKRAASTPVVEGPEPDELLTPVETAKLLKVSKVTIWDWTANRGILTKHTIGNQVRYLKSEVLAAVTKKEANNPGTNQPEAARHKSANLQTRKAA